VQVSLTQAELPDEVYVSIPLEHRPVLAAYYDFAAGLCSMWRMVLAQERPQPDPAEVDTSQVVRLGPGDAPAIRSLYAHGGSYTPDAFDPYQLDNGVFYGVLDGAGRALLAVGGTHIIDWTGGVAAIGNMYTRPDCRGRGLAGRVLTTIVHDLRARQVNTIVLNVNQRNAAARRLYDRHGFVVHCEFLEGVGRRLGD
jgi:ribosomal protein S18 acetylase RimI-like enzyme